MNVREVWLADQLKGRVRANAVTALATSAQDVKTASVKVAPHETNRLRESAYTGVDPDSLIAIVGYDDPRDIKTIVQHEDLTAHHPAGEQAKFLEKPLYASAPRVGARLSSAIGRALR